MMSIGKQTLKHDFHQNLQTIRYDPNLYNT